MSIPNPTTVENCTLTETDLAACRPIAAEGGHVLRALCPFHGSDRQRSLRVTLATGRFQCFACGAWGYLEEARQRWREERQRQAATRRPPARPRSPQRPRSGPPLAASGTPALAAPPTRAERPALQDLVQCLAAFQAALPGSRGAAYLRQRGIPLALAQRAGVGYAAPGTWPHPARDWKGGRLVFPHTDPDGRLVNLYGRAVGTAAQVPKAKRHDHLPGEKGYFNAIALQVGDGPLFVCEGAFDALSLMAAGVPRVVAIFGVHGWRWAWARAVRELVFALDADAAGQQHWRDLARHAALRGKRVAVLPPEAFGGYKDANEAWMAGALRIGAWSAAAGDGSAVVEVPEDLRNAWEERAAIMEWDGGLARPEAERAAWRWLTNTSCEVPSGSHAKKSLPVDFRGGDEG
jgi:DNA primase